MSDQSKGSIPWLGVALVLSLAVNTFFVGTIVGGHATSERWADRIGSRLGLEQHMGPGGLSGMPPELDPRRIGRMLPPSAREEAREILEAREPEIRSLFEAAARARMTAYDAMRAEPFDREALEAAFATSRTADQVAAAAVHDLTAEIINGLSPSERAAIDANIGRRGPQMHNRREHEERWRERRERRGDRQDRLDRQDRPPPRERRP